MTVAVAGASHRRVLELAAQPPVFAERVRASVISWGAGSPWFDGRPLEPGPHSHPGATELFVVLEGALAMSLGRESFTLGKGEVCLIPPDAVHEPLGNAGTDLALVSIVSPNRKGLRFKTSDFPNSAYDAVGERTLVADGRAPSNDQLENEVCALGDGERREWGGRREVDRLLLVVAGEVDVQVPPLAGRLGAGSMVFVAARARHALVGRGAVPAIVLATWATGLDAERADPPTDGTA
jgi:mannose-6-phosphate isomerase-like protein (cupin superfamily)